MGQPYYLRPLSGVARHARVENGTRLGVQTASAKRHLVGTRLFENDRRRHRAPSRSCLFSNSDRENYRPSYSARTWRRSRTKDCARGTNGKAFGSWNLERTRLETVLLVGTGARASDHTFLCFGLDVFHAI